MAVRKAEARWEGTLKEGKGNLKVGSGAYNGGYSFSWLCLLLHGLAIPVVQITQNRIQRHWQLHI